MQTSDSSAGISPFEQEWRTCVTMIRAAAEILRDEQDLPDGEREQLIDVIIEGNQRLEQSFASVGACLVPHCAASVAGRG